MGKGGGGGGGGGRASRMAGGGGGETAADKAASAVAQGAPGAETQADIDAAVVGMRYNNSESVQIASEQALVNSKYLEAKYGKVSDQALQTPQEMGLKVKDGKIIVSEKGAPNLPAKLRTAEQAEKHLADMGFSHNVIQELKESGSLREIGSILPKGSKVIGKPGAEGIGVDIGNGKVWRVQYSGTADPLKTSDIGRLAVYPEWKKQYGKTWIEQKRKVETIGRELEPVEAARFLAHLKQNLRKNYPQISVKRADLHGGNWGVFRNADGTTSIAILDPGGAPFHGAKITQGGFGN